jgi:hypothetical protein
MDRQHTQILAYNNKTAIRSILSTENPVYNVNIENQTQYSTTHQLDPEEDEWFYIGNFRLSIFNTPIAKIGREGIKIEDLFERLTELTQFHSRDYPNINWLITKQGAYYYLQKVIPSSRITSKTFLCLVEGNPAIQVVNNSVEVRREYPDIIYDPTEDRLIFKELPRAKGMFPNLIDLYREATNEEVDTFIFNRTDILIPERFEIGVRNRKEVARLLPKIEALSDEARNRLTNYITEHIGRTNLQRGDDGKIIIANPRDFKQYIALLDERFVTSEVYSEDRVITAFTTG